MLYSGSTIASLGTELPSVDEFFCPKAIDPKLPVNIDARPNLLPVCRKLRLEPFILFPPKLIYLPKPGTEAVILSRDAVTFKPNTINFDFYLRGFEKQA